MKSKEEIEKLAESQYGTEIGSIRGSNPYDLEADRKNGYIKGYTQCQEDMADNKYADGGGAKEESYFELYNFVDEKMIEGDTVAERMINEKGYSLTFNELLDFVDEKMIEGDEEAERIIKKLGNKYTDEDVFVIAKKLWNDIFNNETLTYNSFEEYFNDKIKK